MWMLWCFEAIGPSSLSLSECGCWWSSASCSFMQIPRWIESWRCLRWKLNAPKRYFCRYLSSMLFWEHEKARIFWCCDSHAILDLFFISFKIKADERGAWGLVQLLTLNSFQYSVGFVISGGVHSDVQSFMFFFFLNPTFRFALVLSWYAKEESSWVPSMKVTPFPAHPGCRKFL